MTTVTKTSAPQPSRPTRSKSDVKPSSAANNKSSSSSIHSQAPSKSTKSSGVIKRTSNTKETPPSPVKETGRRIIRTSDKPSQAQAPEEQVVPVSENQVPAPPAEAMPKQDAQAPQVEGSRSATPAPEVPAPPAEALPKQDAQAPQVEGSRSATPAPEVPAPPPPETEAPTPNAKGDPSTVEPATKWQNDLFSHLRENNTYDKDKNGFLSQEELKAVSQGDWYNKQSDGFKESFGKYDWNNKYKELMFANIDPGADAWHELSTHDIGKISHRLNKNESLDDIGSDLRKEIIGNRKLVDNNGFDTHVKHHQTIASQALNQHAKSVRLKNSPAKATPQVLQPLPSKPTPVPLPPSAPIPTEPNLPKADPPTLEENIVTPRRRVRTAFNDERIHPNQWRASFQNKPNAPSFSNQFWIDPSFWERFLESSNNLV